MEGREKRRCGGEGSGGGMDAGGESRWTRTGDAARMYMMASTPDSRPQRPAPRLQSYCEAAPRGTVKTKGVSTRRGSEEGRAEPDGHDDLRCRISSISAFAKVVGQCVPCGADEVVFGEEVQMA
jgi:hypothetical protein